MWKTLNPLNYLVNKKDNNLTTELYFKLNLNKDKSKQIDIQISPNSTVKEVFDNFRQQIEINAIKIDPEIQEYKFILKDKTDKYNEFVLKDDIFLYKYMHEEKYELYYLPFYKKKSYTISVALKDKNSLQIVEKKGNNDYTVLDDQLIKKDNAFKYSKKQKKFVPVIVFLHRDMLEIEKQKNVKFPTTIPLSSISDIKELNKLKYKEGYSIMMISSMYNSKDKRYVLAFESKSFDNWFLLIFNQIHEYLDTFTFMKICDDLSDLNRKKTSAIIQLANKITNIKGVLSLSFSKKIFYEFYDNNEIKKLYDLIIQLRDDIFNKKKLKEEKELIRQIIDIIENKEELKDDKKILDTLKTNLNKINDIVDENKNKIVNIDENKFLNENILYVFIDNIITNYFEPFFNKMTDSKLRIEFMNKIIDYIIKKENGIDNKFLDFKSDIKDLILIK